MTTDEKLDYLIAKVDNLENELNKLKTNNEKNNYELTSKFYDIFRNLRDEISNMDSAHYKHYSNLIGTIRSVDTKNNFLERKVTKLEEHTPLNQFVEKVLPWSPAILISGAVWSLIIYLILNN